MCKVVFSWSWSLVFKMYPILNTTLVALFMNGYVLTYLSHSYIHVEWNCRLNTKYTAWDNNTHTFIKKNEEISTNGIVDVFKCALLVAFPYGKIFTVVLILVKVVAFILYITHCSVSEYPYAYHSCILGIFMLWTAW